MPPNKNQTVRFRIINECLRSRTKRYWSKEELIQEINKRADIAIRERTLDKDLEEMRYSSQLNYYAPIEYSKTNNGYYYTDPDYSIDKLPFNEKDIEALTFATSILDQYKHISILNDFSGVVEKFIAIINHIKSTSHESRFSFIDFERSPLIKGLEYLDVLVEAIKDRKVIEITYQKFIDDEIKTHQISPYLLKEYRNRWFLLGLLHRKEKVITFGLERILTVKVLPPSIRFQERTLDVNSFFKNTIGVSFTEKSPSEVILSFTPLQGKYIKTQPIHETQEVIIDNDLECRIKLDVVVNFELTSLILGFGKEVKVVAPESLKLAMAETISQMAAFYNS